jgi:hypothetical protein
LWVLGLEAEAEGGIMSCRRSLTALIVAAVVLIGPGLQLSTAGAQAACTFGPGFQALHDQIPETVGDCPAGEFTNPATGNVEQRTTNGLLLWRSADGLIGFTNGEALWLGGPDGVVSRSLQEPPFAWEGEPLAVAQAASPPPTTAQQQPALSPVGAWVGNWDGPANLPMKLTVRSVSEATADLTYEWQGQNPGSMTPPNVAVRKDGAVTVLSWGTFEFRHQGEGDSMTGKVIFPGGVERHTNLRRA